MQNQYDIQAKRDIWTIGEEAKYEAWSLESEASQYSAAAKNARKAANINSATTLLSTASQVADMWPKGSKNTANIKGMGEVNVAPKNYYLSRAARF